MHARLSGLPLESVRLIGLEIEARIPPRNHVGNNQTACGAEGDSQVLMSKRIQHVF